MKTLISQAILHLQHNDLFIIVNHYIYIINLKILSFTNKASTEFEFGSTQPHLVICVLSLSIYQKTGKAEDLDYMTQKFGPKII